MIDQVGGRMYKLCFDGLFRPAMVASQAGIMCYGWLLYKQNDLFSYGYGGSARGCNATSNIAEYLGLIDGLNAMIDIGVDCDPITVYGDAKVIINQMKGSARVSVPRVLPIYKKAYRLAQQLHVVEWRWIPRKQNKEADLLSRLALKEIRANPLTYQNICNQVLRDHHRKTDQFLELGGMFVFQPMTYSAI